MSRRIAKLVLKTVFIGGALAASLVTTQAQKTAKAHLALNPTELTWGAPPPALNPAARLAVVSGNPAETGPFTIRLQLPAGYTIAPHWHPTDEYLTVLSGTIALGMGEKLDQRQTKNLPAGSYAEMPAEMLHFAVAKSNAVIQVQGTGPFVVNYANLADDPTQPKKK